MALAQAAAQTYGPDAEQLQNAVADLDNRLAQAEAVLGRVRLPAEASGQVVTS
jgi:multidrug resistance efflux pump